MNLFLISNIIVCCYVATTWYIAKERLPISCAIVWHISAELLNRICFENVNAADNGAFGCSELSLCTKQCVFKEMITVTG